jgi:predicted esterase
MPGDPTWLTSGSEAQAQAVAKATSALDGLTLSSPPAAPAAPAPVVISPGAPHDATLLLLPGFTCSAESMAESWMPAISETLGDRGGRLKLVFLNAPEREVSCYGDERPRLQAWHDYFTDHGGDEGRPELEEEIDEAHVAWSRARIHAAIDAEVALLGGDHSRVAVGGASQGCCMALDAALTHPAVLGGVFASFGQVYACTAASRVRVATTHPSPSPRRVGLGLLPPHLSPRPDQVYACTLRALGTAPGGVRVRVRVKVRVKVRVRVSLTLTLTRWRGLQAPPAAGGLPRSGLGLG